MFGLDPTKSTADQRDVRRVTNTQEGSSEEWLLFETDWDVVESILGAVDRYKQRDHRQPRILQFSKAPSPSESRNSSLKFRTIPEHSPASLRVDKALYTLQPLRTDCPTQILFDPAPEGNQDPLAQQRTAMVLLPIPTIISGLKTQEDFSLRVGPEHNVGECSDRVFLLGDIQTYFRTAPRGSDFANAYHWILAEVESRWRDSSYSSEIHPSDARAQVISVGLPYASDLLEAPCNVSCLDAITELFEQFAILGIRAPEEAGTDYGLLPVNEVMDVCPLARNFFPRLRKHCDEVFEQKSGETVNEFSLFSALFILRQIVTDIRWTPSVLCSSPDSDNEKALNFGLDLSHDVFVACQIFRYFTVTVKSSFDCIIQCPERSDEERDNEPASYLDSLSGLELACSAFTIARMVGIRLMASGVKLCALLCWEALQLSDKSKFIKPSVLIDYHHGRNPFAESHINERPLTPADLYTFQETFQMRIAKLADVRALVETGLQAVLDKSRTITIGEVIESARELVSQEAAHERWGPWNWQVPILSDTIRSVLFGSMTISKARQGLKPDLEPWDEEPSDEDLNLMTIVSGNAFLVMLPERFTEAVNHRGQWNPQFNRATGQEPPKNQAGGTGGQKNPTGGAGGQKKQGGGTGESDFQELKRVPHIVWCPHRLMDWMTVNRLKELMKVKKGWLRQELCEYLIPTLRYTTAPSVDDIIEKHLIPTAENGRTFVNYRLHMEKAVEPSVAQ